MFEYVTFGMTVLSLILHFIAPKTKSKVDDKIAEGVDKVAPVVPMLKPLFPDASGPKPVEGFPTDSTRDHRK